MNELKTYLELYDDLAVRMPYVRKLSMIAHKDQLRDDGTTPYWTHPIQVWETLKKYGLLFPGEAYSTQELYEQAVIEAACYLHDVLEDTSYGPADILSVIPNHPWVLDLAMELSSDVFPKSYPGVKKDPYILSNMGGMSDFARLIKLADRLSNLNDFRHWKPDRQERYARRSLVLVEALMFTPIGFGIYRPVALAMAEEIKLIANASIPKSDA